MSKSDTTSRVAFVIIILALLFAGFFLINPVTHAPTNEAQLEMTVVNEPVKQTQELTIKITDENGVLPESEKAEMDGSMDAEMADAMNNEIEAENPPAEK